MDKIILLIGHYKYSIFKHIMPPIKKKLNFSQECQHMNANLIPCQLRREQPYLGTSIKEVWKWEMF